MYKKFPLLVFSSLLILQCSSKTKIDSKPFGLVKYFLGNAQIYHNGNGAWEPISLSTEVYFLDSIKTEGESRVEITFDKSSLVSVGEKSKIHISEVDSLDHGKKIRIFNYFGTVISDIEKLTRGNHNYEIRTPTAVAAIRGTHFSVFYNILKKSTDVHVLGGKVWVRNPTKIKPVEVLPGFFSTIVRHKEPLKPKQIKQRQWKKFEKLLKPAKRKKYLKKFKIKAPLIKNLIKNNKKIKSINRKKLSNGKSKINKIIKNNKLGKNTKRLVKESYQKTNVKKAIKSGAKKLTKVKIDKKKLNKLKLNKKKLKKIKFGKKK